MRTSKHLNLRATRDCYHGFTLVELLVVMAIISLLAAMLLPVLSETREQARQSQCLSNQKQVYLALQIYGNDHEHFPTIRGGYGENELGVKPAGYWGGTNDPTSENYGYASDLLGDSSYFRKYAQNLRVMYCSIRHRNWAMQAYAHMNYMSVVGDVSYFLNRTYAHVSRVTSPLGNMPYYYATANAGWEWNWSKGWGIAYGRERAGFKSLPVSRVAMVACLPHVTSGAANYAIYEPHSRLPYINWPTANGLEHLARNMTAGDGHARFLRTGPPASGSHYANLFANGM